MKSLLPNDLGNHSQNITFFCATATHGFPNKSKHPELPGGKKKIKNLKKRSLSKQLEREPPK